MKYLYALLIFPFGVAFAGTPSAPPLCATQKECWTRIQPTLDALAALRRLELVPTYVAPQYNKTYNDALDTCSAESGMFAQTHLATAYDLALLAQHAGAHGLDYTNYRERKDAPSWFTRNAIQNHYDPIYGPDDTLLFYYNSLGYPTGSLGRDPIRFDKHIVWSSTETSDGRVYVLYPNGAIVPATKEITNSGVAYCVHDPEFKPIKPAGN